MSEKSIFEDLMISMSEANDFAAGDRRKARAHKVSIRLVSTFTSRDVRQVRRQLQLTQKSFAALMGVSVKTVESWEKGTNHPSGAARRLLEIFRDNPEIIKEQEIISV